MQQSPELSITFQHNTATLTAIASYETFDRNEFNDWDATASNEAGTFFFNDIDTSSQEVRLASPAGGRVQWLAGVYHANESVGGGFYSDFSEAKSLAFWMSTTYGQKVETTGVFGNLDYRLSDRLTLVGGLRYEDETRDLNNFKTEVLAPTPSVRATTSKSQEMGEWTGKLGVEYTLSDDILTYANVSRGVKSGGFTTYNSGLPDQLEPFKFEELIAYETGLKSSFFQRKLQFNAAAFYYDYRDQQLQGILYTRTGRVGRMINVPKSHIQGAEIEAVWRPLPNLTITQALAYKYGEYDEFFFVNSAATEAARDKVTGEYNTIVYSDRAGERLLVNDRGAGLDLPGGAVDLALLDVVPPPTLLRLEALHVPVPGELEVTFGVVVAFIQYVQRMFQPIRDLAEKYNIFQAAMASSERILPKYTGRLFSHTCSNMPTLEILS